LRRVASRQSAGCNRVRDAFELSTVLRHDYDARCSSVTQRNPPASYLAAIVPNEVRGSEPAMTAEDRCKCVREICEAPVAF